MVTGITLKGFILAPHMERLKAALSEDEFAKVEAELGVTLKSLKLSFFKDFPVELQNSMEAKLAEVVYGKRHAEAAFDIGHSNFETFSQSAIGRTTLALIGRDPKKMVKATIRLLSTVMKGMDVVVNDRQDEAFSVRFRNNPHPVQGWHGVIAGALEYAGVKPRIKIVEHTRSDTEYVIDWE